MQTLGGKTKKNYRNMFLTFLSKKQMSFCHVFLNIVSLDGYNIDCFLEAQISLLMKNK